MKWYLEAWKKCVVFDGRARRKEYWMFFLINFIATFVLAFIESLIFESTIGADIFRFVILIPTIAVGVRRMHDTDHSGWWLLYPLVNLVFAVREGQTSENRFGPDPKAYLHSTLNEPRMSAAP